MAKHSKIEWTDVTWNPVRGCSRVSEGCRNCYAERQAARFASAGNPFHGFVRVTSKVSGMQYEDPKAAGEWHRPQWTGKVELVEKHLLDPLKWKKPRRIFVNSMSDLFHESLLDEAIDRVFAVMSLCPQHTFQVLTKRPKRMLEYCGSNATTGRWTQYMAQILEGCGHVEIKYLDDGLDGMQIQNVWLGVSVEDQKTADERIPLLLQTPAAVRFVSYEPALGPVSMMKFLRSQSPTMERSFSSLDWVIVGGESGPGARPFDVAWARRVVQQCREAGVACFVKQMGSDPREQNDPAGKYPAFAHELRLRDYKGGDMDEWPKDLRVRQFPKAHNEEA